MVVGMNVRDPDALQRAYEVVGCRRSKPPLKLAVAALTYARDGKGMRRQA